jgi:hypothetical protein
MGRRKYWNCGCHGGQQRILLDWRWTTSSRVALSLFSLRLARLRGGPTRFLLMLLLFRDGKWMYRRHGKSATKELHLTTLPNPSTKQRFTPFLLVAAVNAFGVMYFVEKLDSEKVWLSPGKYLEPDF